MFMAQRIKKRDLNNSIVASHVKYTIIQVKFFPIMKAANSDLNIHALTSYNEKKNTKHSVLPDKTNKLFSTNFKIYFGWYENKVT